jgi:hypothetical protein
MRQIIRILALVSLALVVLSLVFSTWVHVQDPCPAELGGAIATFAPLFFIFLLAVPLALMGTIWLSFRSFLKGQIGVFIGWSEQV